MSAEAVLALGQVVALLLAGFAIIVTLRGIRDQLWVVVFTEYTGRHAEIVRSCRRRVDVLEPSLN
jgi:hypothetical protein